MDRTGAVTEVTGFSTRIASPIVTGPHGWGT